MKKHVKNIKDYILEHKIIAAIVLMVVVFIGFKIFASREAQKDLFVVRNGDISQKVIVNGKTKAVNSVNLSFEVNGTVRSVSASIGSRVSVGQSLVSLDQSSAYADLMKARANVLSEEARLDELKNGTRPEEIAIYETELENAKIALSDAEKSLADKAKDVINNNVDQLFNNPKTNNPTLSLSYPNTQLVNDINNERAQLEPIINNWDYKNEEVNASRVSQFLEKLAVVVNAQTSGPGLTQSTIDGYKSSVSSARATIISAIGSVNSAKSAISLAQKNLNLKKVGSTPETIKAQEAKVLQNQSEVSRIESQLSKMTLRAPQSGIVTVQDAKVGEVVTPGKIVVAIISDNDLEIESNVSEINIGKVAIGNPVEITFDAFPGEVFKGSVTYIEPAETIVDGVVNYKVTVAFSQKYPQMKSGLTSKLEIITGVKIAVLVIPQYSIKTKDGTFYVSKLEGETFVDTPVTLGLRGQDGFVEVLSGLLAGETIETVTEVK